MNGSIADKLNTNAKNFQLQASSAGNKYYAIPNYIGFANIVYDVDLFETKRFMYEANTNQYIEIIKDYNINKNTQ